jgi:PAS domain-containing protein
MSTGKPTRSADHGLVQAANAWPSGIALFDSCHHLQFVNPGLRHLLDLPESVAPLGITISRYVDILVDRREFVGLTGEDSARQRVEAVKSGTAITTERARPNGRWLEIHHIPIAAGGLLVIYMDVTARVERRWRTEQLILDLKTRVAQLEEQLHNRGL